MIAELTGSFVDNFALQLLEIVVWQSASGSDRGAG
jgi:hypothetical protein